MKTGLVLEGGACRGIFTSGVLDEMFSWGLKFDYAVGVSAGAGNAMCYKSCQPGRAKALSMGPDGHAYFGLIQASESRTLLDLDYLYHKLSYDGPIPLDFQTYSRNPMVCEYVLTDCRTGNAVYLSENVYERRLLDIVKASCSLPGFCPPVKIDGNMYLDGGVADPMPVERALEMGCDRVILVTTKPANNLHPMDYSGKMKPLVRKLYKKRYPLLYDALMTRITRYFDQLDRLLEMEKDGRLLIIRPEVCRIKSLEKDRQKMEEYYAHGAAIARSSRDQILEYLNP